MEESNSNLDRLLQWVKKGTRLYEEDDKFDVCRPNKSTLIHYHDAEKGKEKGSVEKQMMIFSIISPACVSKLGWSCGRLSMDRASPPEYYFQTVLRRVGMDVCRRAKQVPLSALFQRGWAYTPMFDIDVKETEAPFTNDILLEWGRLIVETLLEFYPNCRWTPGVPFLVCSKPESQVADTRVVCSHCSSSEYEIRGDVLRCLKCKRTGPPLEKHFYKIGAHFDFCQYRDPWCRTLLQDAREDDDGTIVYTGSAPTVKTTQMLQVREALVQKIVCMGKDERKRLGLGELQTCIFDIVDEKIYGSDKMADVPSSMARGTNGSLRPCFVAKTKSCSCKAEVERRTGESNTYDDECGLCSGMGVCVNHDRKYVPELFLDAEGEIVEVASANGKYDADKTTDLLRLMSHHVPEPDFVTPGFVCPKGGYHQAETDIVVGEGTTEKDRERNNLLVGLQPLENVGNTRLAKRRAPTAGDARAKKKKFAPSEQLHFSLSSPEGVRVRNTIQAVVRRLWNEYLGNTYVGNYCMCYVDKMSRERTVYIVNIAGQGAGRCPNALHCVCGLQRDRCRRVECLSAWGVHRGQKSPMYVHIEKKTVGAATFVLKCRSTSIGMNRKPCTDTRHSSKCTMEETKVLFPVKMRREEGKKAESTLVNNLTGSTNSGKAEMRKKRLEMIRKRRTMLQDLK